MDTDHRHGVSMLYDDIPAVSLPAEDYEPLPVVFQSAPGNESDGIITVKVVGEINSKNGETANVVNLTTAKVDNITQLITQAGGVELVKTTNTTVIRFPKLLKTELYHINWFWCARAYGKVTASSSRLHMELSNTRKLEWVATLRSAECNLEYLLDGSTGMSFNISSNAMGMIAYLHDVFSVTLNGEWYHNRGHQR